jgi:hypothetical protein
MDWQEDEPMSDHVYRQAGYRLALVKWYDPKHVQAVQHAHSGVYASRHQSMRIVMLSMRCFRPLM